jgi:hypothetical protein
MGFANTAHGAALAKSKASKDIRRDALVSKGIEEDYLFPLTIVLSGPKEALTTAESFYLISPIG